MLTKLTRVLTILTPWIVPALLGALAGAGIQQYLSSRPLLWFTIDELGQEIDRASGTLYRYRIELWHSLDRPVPDVEIEIGPIRNLTTIIASAQGSDTVVDNAASAFVTLHLAKAVRARERLSVLVAANVSLEPSDIELRSAEAIGALFVPWWRHEGPRAFLAASVSGLLFGGFFFFLAHWLTGGALLPRIRGLLDELRRTAEEQEDAAAKIREVRTEMREVINTLEQSRRQLRGADPPHEPGA